MLRTCQTSKCDGSPRSLRTNTDSDLVDLAGRRGLRLHILTSSPLTPWLFVTDEVFMLGIWISEDRRAV